jgi:uncharacterized protein YrrD
MNDKTNTSDHWFLIGGHPVLDVHGHAVGTIADVVYDQDSELPRWGVVNPGVLHSNHYVPLQPPTYVSDEGAVVVPFEKKVIMHAPKAPRDHIITPDLQRELELHYAMTG